MADPQLSQRLPVSQSPQLWEKALGQLEPGVKARLMQVTGGRGNIVAALIKTVNEKRQLCIRRQYKFKTPSGRVVIIRDLLEKMAKWLDRFKGAVDAAVQYDPAHAALPWAAVRFILQIALDDIQAHGSIFEAVESFTRMMGRCAKVEELHLDKTNAATVFLEEALTRLYASILSALATALKYFDRSHAARLFTVIIEPSVLDTLEDQEQEVLKLVSLLDSETIKRLDQQFQRVMDTSTMIKVSMSQTRSVDCLAWLSGTRVHDHHRSMSAAKIPGSCTWIFEQETYRTWLGDSSSSVLILQGIRGCGKSVLMSAIIDSLRERTPASTTPSVPCAFFYCADLMTEPDRSSPDAILRSIIRQLAVVAVDESTCTIDEKLWKLYSQKLDAAQPDKIDLPVLTCEECYSLLLEMTLTNPAYLVIDAVDELSDKARVVLLDMEADDLPTSDDGPIVNFHSYAALHWWDHVRKSGDKDSLEGPTNSIMFEFVFDGNEPEISLAFYLWIDWMHLYAEALPIYHARKRLFGALWSTEGQPIFTASQFGLTALMRRYLEANNDIDVDTTNDIGHTGFYLAAAGGHTEIVRMLHERNANAHIRCGWLGSPLQAACFHGKIETARLLLELGASARAEAKFSSALEAACRGNRPEVAQMLLEQGSVLETEDDFEAAVRWSTETGLEAVVDWLLKFAKPKSRPSAADQATHLATAAIKRGSIRNLKRLLAMNSSAEQVAPRDGIAIASYYGHVEMIEYLHELGLSLDVEGPYGSPLRSACLAGNEAAARLLISWGLDVDTRGEKGHALQAAAMQGHTRLVLLLISEGADVNTGIDRSDEPDPLGTPLEAASYYGNSTVVDILLKAGASPGAGGYFKDAMHAAIEGNQSAVAVHLLQAGYKVEKSLFGTGPAALMNPLGSKRMAELVASKVRRTEASPYNAKCYVWLTGDDEPSLRAQGIEFAMWLIVASAAGDEVMLDVLVDKGVSVNSTLATFNAINAAAMMGHLSVVKKLHEAGALIVYDEASLRRVFSGNHVEVFEYLQENGLQADWSETRHCLVCEALDHGSMSIMKRLVDTTTQLHDHTLALIKICGSDKHSSDQVQMIQYLVDKKANLTLDGTRQVGYASLSTSPLIEACSASNMELVKFLLAHGADVGMPVQHGELNGRLDLYASTPLIAAAGLGNLQIVRILLENGADPNQVCRYSVSNWSTSTTPLSQACKNGRKAVVKELLSLDGLSRDSAQFSDAITCAMAARRGQKEILELLLKRYLRSGMDEGVMRKALEKVPKWKPELVDVLLEYSPSDIVAEFDT
ncbi:hypothetical protein V2A60_000501 [Cordyceps javanica]